MFNNNEKKYVPFFNEFEYKFPRITNSVLTFNLFNGEPEVTIGNKYRVSQLPINQLLKNTGWKFINIGLYKQPFTIRSSPNIHIQHKIRNIAKSVRGTIDLYTNYDINDENNIEFGAGVVIAPTIMNNFGNMSNLSIEHIGYHMFGHTKNVSSDIQILENGIDINSVLKITDKTYIGASYSNLLDIDGITGITGSCFIYSSFENSNIMAGINTIKIKDKNNDDNNYSIFGQHSLSFKNRLGKLQFNTGVALNITTKENSTLSFSVKQNIAEYAFVGSIDTNPLQKKKIEHGMVGIEYDKLTRFSNLGIGIYLDIDNSDNNIKIYPKFGIQLKT